VPRRQLAGIRPLRRAAVCSALALVAVVLAACSGPAPTHALVVRHPERKCALIKFSGCALLLPPDSESDADAGHD
jgi:hypothetical protein